MNHSDRELPGLSGTNPTSDDARGNPFADPGNWLLFYHTAKNMHPEQFLGVAERKLRHAVVPRLPIDFDRRYERRVPSTLEATTAPIATNLETLSGCYDDAEREAFRTLAEDAADGVFTFLDRSIDLRDGDEIDWQHPRIEEHPLLWRLKLQSFAFLKWLVIGFDEPDDVAEMDATFQRWLVSWAESNPIGEERYLRRSWIPHSVSLRLLNWCRYASWSEERTTSDVPDVLYREIFKNALFLENHVEWEVGGNHLVENAAGLVMAGVLFREHDTGWIRAGLDVLTSVVETQFLDDGGHFERSPMYHVLVLTRYLTVVDLLENTGLEVPSALRTVAEAGTAFLRAIRAPDGRLPLLNDSVYDEACSAACCLRYAAAIGVEPVTLESPATLEPSGYYWLGTGRTRMLVDGGSVGPPHLPAHSHNDQLSFSLWVDRRPMIVDTGTYEYAATSRRQYSRSVAAHNTVQVRDTEPIDIGGKYLMGKRTVPEVTLSRTDDEVFRGILRKDSTFGSEYVHRRGITHQNEEWRVRDSVTETPFTSRLHFHPSVSIEAVDDDDTFVAISGTARLEISITSRTTEPRVRRSEYYPAFGVNESRECLELPVTETHGRVAYTLRPLSNDRSSAGDGAGVGERDV